MHISHNVKAIIFDLDGTLVDSMWIWKQIDVDFLMKRQIALPDNLQKEIEGMSFTETALYFMERFQLEDTLEAIQNEWNDMALDFYKHHIPLKKGALKLLKDARHRGIQLGIGTSNSSKLLKAVLDAHGIEHMFHSIRTSCEVKRGKPYPDIFLKVADDLNVLPSECMVFEDTHAGVLAAKRAGMQVIAVYDALLSVYKADIMQDASGYIEHFEEISLENESERTMR